MRADVKLRVGLFIDGRVVNAPLGEVFSPVVSGSRWSP